MLAAVQKVECVSGCGGGSEPSTIAVVGLIVSFISLAVAFYAIRLTAKSVRTSNGSLAIAQEQHAVFLRQTNARARMRITLGLNNAGEDGVFIVGRNTSSQGAQLNIGLKNDGERQARGRELQGFDSSVPTGADDLGTAEAPIPARFLTKTVDLIDTTNHYTAHFRFFVKMDPGRSDKQVPVKLRVSSDDFPDDEPEYVVEEVLRFVRGQLP